MMNSDTDRFFEGEEVQSIFWPGGGEITAGHGNCKKITVVMENGLGTVNGVPWFAVWDDHVITHKYNGAHLEGVKL